MIYILLEYFKSHYGVHVPAAFYYTSSKIMLSLCNSLFFIFCFGTFFIRKLYELKIGQPIREFSGFLLAQLHQKKKNTPTMGGILILLSSLFSMLLWLDFSCSYTWILLFTTLFLGLVGAVDDYLKLRSKNYKGMRSLYKFLFQSVWAGLVIFYLQVPEVHHFFEATFSIKMPLIKDVLSEKMTILPLEDYMARLYVPFFKEPVYIFSGLGILGAVLFHAFVLVGSSNAVNLTDGLDGLASGLVIFVACVLTIFAFLSNHIEIADYLNILYVDQSGQVAVFLAAIIGAVLGFLWFNSHPAEVFMGDIGSLSLGGILGVSALLLKRELLFGLVGALFVIEALSVIIQVISYRYFNQRRVFRCAPLHHHFEYLGWPESKVVIRFWIVAFLLGLIGLVSIKFQ